MRTGEALAVFRHNVPLQYLGRLGLKTTLVALVLDPEVLGLDVIPEKFGGDGGEVTVITKPFLKNLFALLVGHLMLILDMSSNTGPID